MGGAERVEPMTEWERHDWEESGGAGLVKGAVLLEGRGQRAEGEGPESRRGGRKLETE